MNKRVSLSFMSKLLVIVFCLGSFAFTADAQRRKAPVRKATAKPAATAATPPPTTTADIKEGAQKVSTQIKNVSKFIYILGGVASGIEAIDADIRDKKITRAATIDQNKKNKDAVVTTIRNLRAGLSALEDEFNAKIALRNYTLQIGGITNLAAQSEDQASRGQLTESGKTLLLIVEKLSDTLVALP